MYKTLHKKQGSVTVQLRFARSSVTFCAKRDNNGIGQTKFVMLQGIAGAFGVRVPVSYLMSIRPDTSLFKIGLATPMSSVVQLLLCLGFMVILNRRARKGEIR